MKTRGLPGMLAPRYQECLASGSTVLWAASLTSATHLSIASARASERVELDRLRLGLTKIGFAELLGVDRKILQRFDNSTGELPEHCLNRLCAHSGYPNDFFHL